ncbi:MAG: putative metal-binding motif-containing protein [Nannocystaceae bacterium]
MRLAPLALLLPLIACGSPESGESASGTDSGTDSGESEASGDASTGSASGATNGGTAGSASASATSTAGTGSGTDSSSATAGCDGPPRYPDDDGDTYGDPDRPIPPCEAGPGDVDDGTDCDDSDPAIHPGADEALCDGVDYDCDGHWKTQVPSICPTIQAAVDVAPDGAVICVAPGVYAEHVTLAGHDLTLLGLEGPAMTTIDGATTGRPLTIEQGEGPETRIEGFTLTRGRAAKGAGLYVSGASPTLVDLVFVDNHAEGDSAYGGGAYLRETSASLTDVVFVDNSAGYYGGGLSLEEGEGVTIERGRFVANAALYGGGASLYYSTVAIENAIFAGNTGTAMGGGVLAQGEGLELLQAALVDNSSTYGGGGLAAISGAAVAVRNVAFSDNVATYAPSLGGAIQRCTDEEIDGGTCSATVTVAYTDAWASAPKHYGNMDDPIGADGNASIAPAFVDASSPDPRAWDLHPAPGSPLIDAGDPQVLDPDRSRSDIGAYGGPSSWP